MLTTRIDRANLHSKRFHREWWYVDKNRWYIRLPIYGIAFLDMHTNGDKSCIIPHKQEFFLDWKYCNSQSHIFINQYFNPPYISSIFVSINIFQNVSILMSKGWNIVFIHYYKSIFEFIFPSTSVSLFINTFPNISILMWKGWNIISCITIHPSIYILYIHASLYLIYRLYLYPQICFQIYLSKNIPPQVKRLKHCLCVCSF